MAGCFEAHADVGAGYDDCLGGEFLGRVGEFGEELGFEEGSHFRDVVKNARSTDSPVRFSCLDGRNR